MKIINPSSGWEKTRFVLTKFVSSILKKIEISDITISRGNELVIEITHFLFSNALFIFNRMVCQIVFIIIIGNEKRYERGGDDKLQ